MAHFTYPPGTPTGVVPSAYVVPETDWAHVIATGFKSVNGDDGGTWAPGEFITVGGSGLQLTGTGHELAGSARLTLQSLAQIRVENGAGILLNASSGDIDIEVTSNVAQIVVNSGAKIEVDGDLNVYSQITLRNTNGPGAFNAEDNTVATFESGSELEIEAGALLEVAGDLTVLSGGDVSLESGSEFSAADGSFSLFAGEQWFSGATTFVEGTWPLLSLARTCTRPGVKIIPLTYNHGAGWGPADPDAWEVKSNLSNAPCFQTSAATAAGDMSIIEVVDLPIGSVITGAMVSTRGTVGGSTTSTLPTYRIVSWLSGVAGLANHSNETTDAGSAGTFPTTTTETEIGVIGDASTRTVTAGRRYGILINHPYQSGDGQGVRVYEAAIETSATSMQI